MDKKGLKHLIKHLAKIHGGEYVVSVKNKGQFDRLKEILSGTGIKTVSGTSIEDLDYFALYKYFSQFYPTLFHLKKTLYIHFALNRGKDEIEVSLSCLSLNHVDLSVFIQTIGQLGTYPSEQLGDNVIETLFL